MTLEELGYYEQMEEYRKENNLDSFGVGRVISEHKLLEIGLPYLNTMIIRCLSMPYFQEKRL